MGTLSQDDTERFEESYFDDAYFDHDDVRFEELEIAETELIDAYVREKLSPDDRERFQSRLLTSPRIVDRVEFARALAQKVSLSAPRPQVAEVQDSSSIRHFPLKPKTPWWRKIFGPQPAFGVALATCVVFIIVGGFALVSSEFRLRFESSRLAAERATLQQQKEELEKQANEQRTQAESLNANLQRRRDQLEQQIKLVEEQQRNLREGPGPSVSGSMASFFLLPGGVRSPGSRSDLAFGPEVSNAQISLALVPGDYRNYSVSIKRPDGDEVFTQKGLKPIKMRSGMVLVISVPTRRLPPDDYNVDVEGQTSSGEVEAVSDYHFRVLPRAKP